MKKFIKEKYADLILQICTDYKNRNPVSDDKITAAVDRALETLDKYSNYILGMGYMLHMEDVPYLKQCVQLAIKDGRFTLDMLDDVYRYLEYIETDGVY